MEKKATRRRPRSFNIERMNRKENILTTEESELNEREIKKSMNERVQGLKECMPSSDMVEAVSKD